MLRRIFFALLLALAPGATFAQDFPVKPIRMVIGFPPGGPLDVVGRILSGVAGGSSQETKKELPRQEQLATLGKYASLIIAL